MIKSIVIPEMKVLEKDGYTLRLANISDAENYYTQNYNPLDKRSCTLDLQTTIYLSIYSIFRSNKTDEGFKHPSSVYLYE
ncbi:MAG: hypothetical protein NC350_01540 [Corallococcus sp.]|nr:hypothetical protein [Corallococcus sp.]